MIEYLSEIETIKLQALDKNFYYGIIHVLQKCVPIKRSFLFMFGNNKQKLLDVSIRDQTIKTRTMSMPDIFGETLATIIGSEIF